MSDVPATESPPLIYGALAKAMGAVVPAPQDGTNTHFNYKYASVSAVYTVASRALADAGVCVVSTIVGEDWEKIGNQRLCRLHVDHTFYAEDGSSVLVQNIGEGTDVGDKAANKAWQAARKFALIVTLCIPTDAEDSDGDGTQVADAPLPPSRSRPRVPPKILPMQTKKLMAIFGEHGIPREERLGMSAVLSGVEGLTTSKDLTQDEAFTLIGELERLAKEGPTLRDAYQALLVDREGADADARAAEQEAAHADGADVGEGERMDARVFDQP